jgi:peptidoglycan hydrolase CwlO-like protein
MVKFIIMVLLIIGLISALIYVGQAIFKNQTKDKKPTGPLSDLKLEVEENVSRIKRTKEKVTEVRKEVDEIQDNLG